ncbi:AAA family ATPase [Mollicutes bacterium LVI A0078]|nr:AAA family ATPase [Mollicutes bacterium LVI A0075]WOO90554.1 AAA family ATPase [Mollicutes bacterium LVI A0078]
MKVISVYNNKGGVGKTTTTKRLAMNKANKGNKVLIIDMDPQGNISSQFTSENKMSVYDVLLNDLDVNKAIVNTEHNNIDILPAKLNLLNANNEIMLESLRGKNPTQRLAEAMFLMPDEVDSQHNFEVLYDYVLIDCPPTMDLLVSNALTCTDEVIIPLSVDNYSLDGINMLLEKIEEVKNTSNTHLKISGVFLNRYKRSNIHDEMKSVIDQLLSDYVAPVVIGDYAVINENTFTLDESKIEKHKVTKQFDELFESLGV